MPPRKDATNKIRVTSVFIFLPYFIPLVFLSSIRTDNEYYPSYSFCPLYSYWKRVHLNLLLISCKTGQQSSFCSSHISRKPELLTWEVGPSNFIFGIIQNFCSLDNKHRGDLLESVNKHLPFHLLRDIYLLPSLFAPPRCTRVLVQTNAE